VLIPYKHSSSWPLPEQQQVELWAYQAEIASTRRFTIGLDHPKEIYTLVACMSLSYDNSSYSLLHERIEVVLTPDVITYFLTYLRLIAQCIKLY